MLHSSHNDFHDRGSIACKISEDIKSIIIMTSMMMAHTTTVARS